MIRSDNLPTLSKRANVSDYVTLAEASSYLGVSKATLRNWDKAGKLKALRHPVNDYRMYSLVDLRQLRSQLPLFEPSSPTIAAPGSPSPLTIREVRKVLSRLHNALRDTDANSSLIARFDEVSKLLALALFASEHQATHRIFHSTNLSARNYATQIRTAYRSFCRDVPVDQPDAFVELHCSDAAIHECGKILSLVDFRGAPVDVKGLAYEEMIRRTFDKTDNQQFFTPHHIVSFMTDFYADHIRGHICDPASGTGGFLVEVAKSGKPYSSLTAFEIDERLSWVTGLNVYLHGGHDVFSVNLGNGGSLGREAESYFSSFDLILTNPPFGSDYSDQDELNKYVLGRGRPSRRRGILFLERCAQLLKPNGRMGIIIDEGVLNLSHAEDVRRFLLDHFSLDAIISLPDTAFMPYANVNASILFLRKNPSSKNTTVFFARAEKVGRKTNGDDDLLFHSDGGVSLRSDLPDILDAWSTDTPTDRKGFERCYRTSVEEHFEVEPGSFRLDYRFHHPSRDDSISKLESSKWPLFALGDLCDERNNSVIPSKELTDTVILYTGLAHIHSHNGVAHQEPTPANSLKSAVKQYEPHDIVFARMRPNLRKVALMNFPDGGYVSPECVVLSPRRDEEGKLIIDPVVLSVVLRSDLVFGQITHLIAGIGRPRLNAKDLRRVRIPVPPIDIQRDIRIEYERVLEGSKALRAQATRLHLDATEGERSAVASLAVQLAG